MNFYAIFLILIDAWTDTLVLKKLFTKFTNNYVLPKEYYSMIQKHVNIMKHEIDKTMKDNELRFNETLEALQANKEDPSEFLKIADEEMINFFDTMFDAVDNIEDYHPLLEHIEQHRRNWFSFRGFPNK